MDHSTDEPSSTSSSAWLGAPLPRGFANITDVIELKGCDLLNADEGTGQAGVLFAETKPRALTSSLSSSQSSSSSPSTTTTTAENSGPRDFVESGADDQLLMFMPFHSIAKLFSIQV